MSRVYTSPDSKVVRIAAWSRNENGDRYSIALYPVTDAPGLALSWFMRPEDARALAASLVAAADAVDAGTPEVTP